MSPKQNEEEHLIIRRLRKPLLCNVLNCSAHFNFSSNLVRWSVCSAGSLNHFDVAQLISIHPHDPWPRKSDIAIFSQLHLCGRQCPAMLSQPPNIHRELTRSLNTNSSGFHHTKQVEETEQTKPHHGVCHSFGISSNNYFVPLDHALFYNFPTGTYIRSDVDESSTCFCVCRRCFFSSVVFTQLYANWLQRQSI